MRWTIIQNGKKVVKEIATGVAHNPPCRTERCKRRNARKGK